jgi:RNase H-fold protein (predicted Holliday junction resolvase)
MAVKCHLTRLTHFFHHLMECCHHTHHDHRSTDIKDEAHNKHLCTEQIMSTNNITKILTTPSKVASALDWRMASTAILSLDIQKGRIGLAVASHPSFQEPAKVLESIPFSRRRALSETVSQRLADIVKEHNICGFVVSWPLQKDTGKLGYSCGLALHTLEQLLKDSKVMTSNRPVCLWDRAHTVGPTIDNCGRCADYARTSDKTLHLASKEQYHVESSTEVASEVMDDFLKVNWPSIYEQQKVYKAPQNLNAAEWDREYRLELQYC